MYGIIETKVKIYFKDRGNLVVTLAEGLKRRVNDYAIGVTSKVPTIVLEIGSETLIVVV